MSRRGILVLAIALALPLAAQEKPLTPEALWSALVAGNRTFVAGTVEYKGLEKERAALGSEAPPITILACSDSRVPPELIFNQSLGALYVIRSAANVPDELALASIEHAITKKWTKLIVVLGHENCALVEEALKPNDPSSLSLLGLVNRIRHTFIWGQTSLPSATKANARAATAWLTAESSIVRQAVTDGVRIVPAYYELKSGAVTPID